MPRFRLLIAPLASRFIFNLTFWLAACFLTLCMLGGQRVMAQSGGNKDSDHKADANLKSAARINPSTLAMEFTLPLGAYPGRAGNSVPLALNYSSKVWQLDHAYSWRSVFGTYISDLRPKYAERTAAGWTSSLMSPRIDMEFVIYDEEGQVFDISLEAGLASPDSGNGPVTINTPFLPCWVTSPGLCWECYAFGADGNTCLVGGCGYCGGGGSGGGSGGSLPPTRRRKYVKRLRVQMPDGATHEFRKSDAIFDYCSSNPPGPNDGPNCEQVGADQAGEFLSVDGSRMRLFMGASESTLYLPDGSRYLFGLNTGPTSPSVGGWFAHSFVDKSGNKMSFSQNTPDLTNPTTWEWQWTDTMGRVIKDPLPLNWRAQMQQPGTKVVPLTSFNGQTLNYKVSWGLLQNALSSDSRLSASNLFYSAQTACNGNLIIPVEPFLFHTTTHYTRVCGSRGPDGQPPPLFNPVVMTQVELPNGIKYKFHYNQYGEMVHLEYPGGGWEKFKYETVPMLGMYPDSNYSQTNRGVVERWVSFDGENEEQHWQYTATSLHPAHNPVPLYFVTTKAPDGTRTERFMHRSSDDSYFGFENPLAGMAYEEKIYSASCQSTSAPISGCQPLRRSLTEYATSPPRASAGGNTPIIPEPSPDPDPTPGGGPGPTPTPPPNATPPGSRDPRAKRTLTLTFEPGAANALAQLSESEYDTHTDAAYFAQLNVKRAKTYHFAAVPLAEAQNADLATLAATYFSNSNLAAVTETDYLYQESYKARNINGLATEARLYKGADSAPVSKTQMAYDEAAYLNTGGCALSGALANTWTPPPNGTTALGHATTTRTFSDVNNNSTAIAAHAWYDQFGNVVKTQDALGREATTQYGGQYGCAYPVSATGPAADAGGVYGSNQQFTTTTTYDFTTGLPLSVTDANGQTATTTYDQYLRPLRVNPPAGGAISEIEYHELPAGQAWSLGAVWVKKRAQVSATQWAESVEYFDGLGRAVRGYAKNDAVTQTDGACAWSGTATEYDNMGRVLRTSQPFCAANAGGGAPGNDWTIPVYDDLGRVVEVKTPDNAKVLTSYDLLTTGNLLGSVVTVTDQALKQRRSVTDALGRLARVDEPTAAGLGLPTAPNQPTHYTYDIQGNLRKVDQGGQLRYFAYDSLNRLLRAKNPEQADNAALSLTDAVTGHNGWSMGYTYNAAGNLLTRTDARNVVTSYAYDNLNRNTVTTYSDATPEVKRYYDGFREGQLRHGQTYGGLPLHLPLAKGMLWQTETANAALVTHHDQDALGRPRTLTQAFFGNGGFEAYRYEVKREYDLTGAVTKQIYPSGHEVRYNFDAVKRLGDVPDANPQQPDLTRRAFNGNLGDGVTRSYADTPKYDERGLMASERYGMVTPLHHRMNYNVRGQMTDMQLGSGTGADAFNRGRIQNYYAGTAAAPTASGTNNNGNLLAQDNSLPAYPNATGATTFRQTYGYDELNRLAGVSEFYNGAATANWQQSYIYDRWGNRLINQTATTNGIPKPDFTCDTTTNRLLPGPTMPGAMAYDAAGNLTNDTATGNGGRVFDAENRMASAQGNVVNGVSVTQFYTYDGDGRRIIRGPYQSGVWQIYGFEGELLAEYAANSIKILPQKEYGYVGGKLLITANGGDDNRLRRFVENLYYRTWGYLPAGKGQTQINQIVTALGANGQANTAAMLQAAQDLAAGLFDSSQYANVTRTNEQYVADLYLAYLQRAPEPGAIPWYAGFLNNGQLTRLQLRNEFANGPEFAGIVNALWGSQSGDYDRVDRLVTQIYTAATGAPPTTAQRDGERGRFDLAEAKGLNDVKEAGKALGRDLLGANTGYRLDLSATEYVTRLYETFLRRAPDNGLSGYVTQADSNGRSSVLEAFLSMSAYTERSGALYREIFWLISDHLGTPRMIAERTGKLEGIKRSDYLPFGESANQLGGRAATPGYVAESVRQGFVGYEEDTETDLGFAEARYYAKGQGRFTSVDPLLSSAEPNRPQGWNRYSYSLNNPLLYTDPDGLYVFHKSVDKTQREQFRNGIVKAREDLKTIAATYGPNSKEYADAKRAIDSYGEEGINNGVEVRSGTLDETANVQVEGVAGRKTKDNPTGQSIRITIDKTEFKDADLVGIIAHEGSHIADGADWVKSGFSDKANLTSYQTEFKAFTVSSLFQEATGPDVARGILAKTVTKVNKVPGHSPTLEIRGFGQVDYYWMPGWKGPDLAKLRSSNIAKILTRTKEDGGTYDVSATDTKFNFTKGARFRTK